MIAALGSASRERFEITRTLGEGGMGIVYEAFDRVRGETVALKTLRHSDAEAVYRLKREFRSLANLEHPNLVRLLDLFVDDETCFFTMELVCGTDLATYVAGPSGTDSLETRLPSGGLHPFEEGALRHVLVGLLRGLEGLHAAGLLHRDLKPSNVLVTMHGRVVLLDFGLVVDAHAAVQQTRKDAIAGTAAYMAPEQARGESELTTACDVYAIGSILYELLTGRVPFEGPALRVLLAKQTQDPPLARGLVPSIPEDLDELAYRLMARDPLARPSVREVLEALGETQRSRTSRTSSDHARALRLFGRDDELRILDAGYRRTHEGRPSLALVRGRSGIGKSALLQAFGRQVEAEGAIVLAGRCYEFESVPFKGLDGIVDALSRVLAMASPEDLGRLLPPNLGDLATLFPVLRRVKPIASAYARRSLADHPVQRVRARGFACLRELLRRMAESTPLVVVLDDVQWSDEDSARGLVELVRGEHPPQLMLLLGSRPSEEAPVLRDLFEIDPGDPIAALPRVTIELGPLSDAAMRELVGRELGPDLALAEMVARDARGVPFAAGELVRFLREGMLDHGSFDASLPIDVLVRRRVDLLDERARSVLELLAIAGEPAPFDLLLRALSYDEDDRSPIDALRARAFVRSMRSGTGVVLDTAHDRVREAVVAAMADGRRVDLHRRLAVAMESLEKPPHDRLARHFAAAGVRTLAKHHAKAAAEQAQTALAFRRAADFYALAIELSEEDERLSLLVARADALALAGRYDDAAACFLSAAEHAPEAHRRELRRQAAESLLYAGRIDDGLDLLESVAGDIGVRIPQSRWAVAFEIVKSQVRLLFRGLAFREPSAAHARPVDLERVRVLGAIALQYTPLDPFRGLVLLLRYLLAALDLGDVDEIVVAIGAEASARGSFGWERGARTLIALLERIGLERDHVVARSFASMARSLMALFAGDRTASLPYGEEAIAMLAAHPSTPPWLQSIAYYTAGVGLHFEVRLAPIERMVRFIEEREEQGGPYCELRLRSFILPHHLLRLGRPEDVLDLARRGRLGAATRRDVALRVQDELHASWADVYLGDGASAHAGADRVQAAWRRNGFWRVAMARGNCLSILGASGLLLGDVDVVERAHRAMGRPRNDAARLFDHLLRAMRDIARGRTAQACKSLHALGELAHGRGFPVYEAVACFGLGRIAPEARAEPARARYLELVTGSRVLDPDRFFWSMLPIGEAPPRTGRQESAWARAPDAVSSALACDAL